ncbi:hypothetical protein IB292_01955 [Vibrio parahaemolyticus]|uniref:Uncharacterized protein n=1 Tax=Vibrio parahaemolyticus TaxID=670 RepID=A0A9Q3UC45_VIBPH|nr:hypothetical protein [Vibrio parahaemolyticus]MCC3803791.1 hypothetical protein [Vibrio parahaemolyticus]
MSVQENAPTTEQKSTNQSTDDKAQQAQASKVDNANVAPQDSSESNSVDSKVDSEAVKKPSPSKKNTDHDKGFISEKNFSYLLIALLVIISFVQIRQISALQQDNEWLAQQITNIQNSEEPEQKFAIMSFDDTVKSWRAVDPSGKAISKIMDTTIQSYNGKGITILDSTAVIGGKGNLEFIDVSPERYMKEQTSDQK